MSTIETYSLNVAKKLSAEQSTFLRSVKAYILDNIGNPYFGTLELSSLVGITSSQLSRRLKEITECSPAKLIRHFRMEYATVLLSETDDSIKEISYKTGFIQQGNFCRTFKSSFQQSPTDFRILHRKEPLSFDFHCSSPMTAEDIEYLTWLVSTNPFLDNTIKAIASNIQSEKFNTAQLAAILSVSTYELSQKIEDLLKISVSMLVKNIRLQYASESLVHGSEAITRIAYSSGFFDAAHFCKSFKAAYHLTPGEFRLKVANVSVPSFITQYLTLSKNDIRQEELYNKSDSSKDRFVQEFNR